MSFCVMSMQTGEKKTSVVRGKVCVVKDATFVIIHGFLWNDMDSPMWVQKVNSKYTQSTVSQLKKLFPLNMKEQKKKFDILLILLEQNT